MDKIDVVEAACPRCSPEEGVMHTVVKRHLVKCEQCGFIHRLPHEKKKAIKARVIVSRQQESSTRQIEVNEDEELHAGDEFVIDVGEDVSGVRIQSLELKTGGRAEKAKARDVRTIWARAIDEVVVKIAVQQKEKTESLDYKVNGDYEFAIGDVMRLKEYEVAITAIKVRDGGLFKREGRSIKAKDIRRIYSKILSRDRRAAGEGLRTSRTRKGGKGRGTA
ncbi:MAG TPA: HVO_0476 family zinc finger protein [Methanocella sp.]|nr:HVO_0476 family zinc finger protein [Methanocella sp.]